MRSRLVAVVSMVLVGLAGGAVAVFAATGPKPSPGPDQYGTTKNTNPPVVTKPATLTVTGAGKTAAPAVIETRKPTGGTSTGGDKPTKILLPIKSADTTAAPAVTVATGPKAPPVQDITKTTTIETTTSPKSVTMAQAAPAATSAAPAVTTTTKATPPTSTGGDKPTEVEKRGKGN